MKKIVSLLACVAGLLLAGHAAPANCEEHAESISFSASGGYRTVRLVAEYDPDDKSYDSTNGVYYLKAKLERGKSYTIWTEGVGTNENISVLTYAADAPESSDDDGPSADFDEIEEPGLDQRLILYADDWYIDDEDPAESDPKSWTYYIEITGDVGDAVTVCFQLGVVIPQGREDNPLTLTPRSTVSSVRRALQTNNEYYLRTRLVAGQMYWFGTAEGTTNNVLDVTIDGEDPADETQEAPTCRVYDDPAFAADEENTGFYVLPNETGYFNLVVSGDNPATDDDAENGDMFTLSYRLLSSRAIEEHDAVDLEVGAEAVVFEAGALSALDRTTNGVYDAVIDESLFRFAAAKGTRYVAETTEAATNLLMRVYDAKGKVLAENTGDGLSLNARCAFVAPVDGFLYVGVCQRLEDELNEEPAYSTARIQIARAESIDGDPDAWDASDDAVGGATVLSPVPGAETDAPETIDAEGNGWHRLNRTDWADVFRINGRKGVVYSLRASLEDPSASFNTLRAEVFSLSGSSERVVEASGDVNAGSDAPLAFTATANTTYYVRLSVAEGAGLDYPAYKLHALAYSSTGAALGTLTVNTHGTTAGTFSLGSETLKYPGGSSVLASGEQTVKFGAVAGFSTPAVRKIDVAAGTTPTVVDVYYSDTFDPKDDAWKTPTAWTMKNVETSFARTLWPDDEEDNFAITGADGYYYTFALRDVTGDAVFSITNALLGMIVENATEASLVKLPKSAAKYFLTVKHGTEAKTGGSYTLAGKFANVGAIKFAKTAVSVKDTATSVVLTVNRTAKDGAVKVKYATADDTAEAGEQYYAQSGVLEWAPNDNKAKTITVRLIPKEGPWYNGGNHTFSVTLEDADGEYPAQIAVATATVTITESSRETVTKESVYAKSAAKLATVAKSEAVDAEVGTFYGVMRAEDENGLTNGLPRLASVTLTTTAATATKPATFSAKVLLAGKTYTFKATDGWDSETEAGSEKTLALVQKVANVTYTNLLAVGVQGGNTSNGWMRAGGEVELVMNVPDASNKGVQANVSYAGKLYRQNAKVQDYLTVATNFTGYYTVALKATEGYEDGNPAGNGYLTVTVDNKGGAKVAGLLPDSTKVSLSATACAVLPDLKSANGWKMIIPIYQAKSPYCFGGELVLRGGEDSVYASGSSESKLWWYNDNALLTYGGEHGWQMCLTPEGGWFDTLYNLQHHYKDCVLGVETDAITEFPSELVTTAGYSISMAVEPNGADAALAGDGFAVTKQALVKSGSVYDLVGSVNPCNVQIKVARKTGLVTGTFAVWSENGASIQRQITGIKHNGVLLLTRDPENSVLGENVLSAGFCTKTVKVTTTNAVTGKTTSRNWNWSAPFNVLAQ